MSRSIGMPPENERMDPAVMSVGLLREIADRLLSLEDIQNERGSRGVVEPIEPVTVRGTRIERVYPPDRSRPWFSVSIINNAGSSDVYALINSPESMDLWHRVEARETYAVEMNRPVINDVLLRCGAEGDTATVRVVGVR